MQLQVQSRIHFRVGRALSSETVLHLKDASFVFYPVTPNSTPENNPNWLRVSNDTMSRRSKGHSEFGGGWPSHSLTWCRVSLPQTPWASWSKERWWNKNLCSILKEKQGEVESRHSYLLKSNPASTLTLNFQPLELWEYKFLLLKLPCLWYSI